MIYVHVEVVKLLKEAGAATEARDEFRKSALIYASLVRHVEMVKLKDPRPNIEAKHISSQSVLIYTA